MAAVIPAGRYSIQSVMFPGLVLDLQGGGILPGTPWNLAHIHPPVANTTFTLRADAPASHVFAPNVVPGTGIDGSPLALSQLEAHPVAGGGPNVFQIIPLDLAGGPAVAFTAQGGPGGQVELQEYNPANLSQRWTFVLLP